MWKTAASVVLAGLAVDQALGSIHELTIPVHRRSLLRLCVPLPNATVSLELGTQ